MADNANDYTTCEEDPNAPSYDGPFSLESAMGVDINDQSMSTNNSSIIISEKIDRNLVFGNDVKNKCPTSMGKLCTCIFINNHPIIVIGPQGKNKT